jgi:uncharacterized protein (UPF0305 family)
MMTYQYQLVADIMADLTGRFGDLTQASIDQHLSKNIDPEYIELMVAAIRETLTLAKAAAIMARPAQLGEDAW